MSRDHELDYSLLARYFAGECSTFERAQVEQFIASDPTRAEEIEAMRLWWESAGALPSPTRVDAMWGTLARRIHESGESPAPLHAHTARARHTPALTLMPREQPRRRVWRIAAAVAATLVVATGIGYALRTRDIDAVAVAPEPEWREFATARGQRATIRLLDGTRVELGFASTLRVRPFADSLRELVLEGEAVFDVVHDPARPFVVRAGNAITEDLGTTFAIRAYDREQSVRVVVMSGKVAVRPLTVAAGAPRDSAILGPGDLARLGPRGLEVTSHVDTSTYTAWLSGRITYNNARLDEIAADLERRFDVSIRFAEPALGARRVTVKDSARTLNDVLDAVALTARVRHRTTPDGIVVER